MGKASKSGDFDYSKLNLDKISNAVLEAKRGDGTDNLISIAAREQAMELTQGWIERYAAIDVRRGILSVENPFFLWLDQQTLLVGVMDRIDSSPLDGGYPVEGCEWKSTKSSPRWTQEKWLDSIATGPQLSIYALALREGSFVKEDGSVVLYAGDGAAGKIAINVRAGVKSSPPDYWPHKAPFGRIEFEQKGLDAVWAALLARGQQIRVLREMGIKPWQLTGQHCFYQFGKDCEFLESCRKHEHPTTQGAPGVHLSPGDPGMKAFATAWEEGKKHVDSSQLVILSASSYDLGTTCMEKYRLISGNTGSGEGGGKIASIDLDIGTGFHTGIAEVNRQIMQIQREGGLEQ